MKAESTILVSLATGIASVCLLLTCLNMYMLSNMRTTLKSLDGRLADKDTPEAPYESSALVEEPAAYPEKDDLIAALYRHLDHKNNLIAQYEMKLQHLAELHELRRQLLEEQEAVRQHHLQTQKALESQKRKLAKKLTKFQLETQAHEHRKQIEEYERQLHQTFDQLYELQRRQEEARELKPLDNFIYPEDPSGGVVFTMHHEDEFPFSPLEHFLSQLFGPGVFEEQSPEEDFPANPDVTVFLTTAKGADDTQASLPDFAEDPVPVEDADVLADSDANHVVVNRVLPDLPANEVQSTTPLPVLPTAAA